MVLHPEKARGWLMGTRAQQQRYDAYATRGVIIPPEEIQRFGNVIRFTQEGISLINGEIVRQRAHEPMVQLTPDESKFLGQLLWMWDNLAEKNIDFDNGQGAQQGNEAAAISSNHDLREKGYPIRVLRCGLDARREMYAEVGLDVAARGVSAVMEKF